MHDLVVHDLEQATSRTLGLTDLDDPTLVTQHDPLVSPLMRDLPHNGVADLSILGPHPHAESACDSAHMAAHLFDLGPERAGEFVRGLGKRDPDARLNLLLTGGRRIIATRWNDSLSILGTRGGAAVASNPMTTTRAGPTSPDHHLVDMADGVVTGTELEA